MLEQTVTGPHFKEVKEEDHGFSMRFMDRTNSYNPYTNYSKQELTVTIDKARIKADKAQFDLLIAKF